MDREIKVFSPGKINLHLDIKSRREDGFHGIISLFHKVDLCDEITICSLKNENNCRVTGEFDCAPGENLIIRAAELFRKITGISASYEFRVTKNIPSGAGLGGGSGNAAAVLKELNRINGFPLDSGVLFRTGAQLGSDVPFFLGGAAALVTGRGEFLEELPPLRGISGVLIVPEQRISTPEAYRLFDREGRVDERLDTERVRSAYLERRVSEWPFFNSFRDLLYRKYPVLERAERSLTDSGSEFCSLSGSGSAVFGLFSDERKTESVAEELKNDFKQVWKIKLLAK